MSSPLLEAFLGEARELIEQIGALALELEQKGQDPEAINSLFRAVHTLKGGSGLFDIAPFTAVVHAAEDVLSQVRDAALELTAADMDLLLAAMDQAGFWLDDLERQGGLAPDADAIAQRLARELRRMLGGGEPGVGTPATPPVEKPRENALQGPLSAVPAPTAAPMVAVADSTPPPWLDRVPAAARAGLARAGGATAILYTPDEQCFFQGLDPLLIVRTLPGLAWWRVTAREEWPELERFDPYRCVLQIQALVAAPLTEVQHHLRYVLDQVELDPVAAVDLDPAASPAAETPAAPIAVAADESVPAAAPPSESSAARVRRIATDLVREQRDALLFRLDPDLRVGQIASVITVLSRLLPHLGQDDALNRWPTVAEQARRDHQTAPLLALIDDVLTAVAPATPPAPADSLPKDMTPAAPPPVSAAPREASAAPREERQRVLKVDAERIDVLMDLIGELIVAKNALPFLARRALDEFKVRGLAREIKAHFSVINRIADDLQGAVMQLRMIPVGTAFQRFPRLVRDISRKLGKQVELELRGEETEADKNVVADLSDPLIHLVRNALDHGIEPPAERVAAGKPPTGHIQIKAHQQEDRVLIEVSDDGRGMDPERLKRKAYEKGLLSEDALERLSDREALHLIFAPGFSTAAAISDLSGRGVGMDVVRNAMQRAGGEITLDSTPGLGTTVRLSLPLSMTVTQVMMIRAGDEDFGVPFDAVRETVRLPIDQVRRIKKHEAMVLRERLLPLHRLDRLLGLCSHADDTGKQELSIIVATVGGTDFALVVDDVREGVDVILKPLEGVMASFPLYAGTALLGDGRVLLVLNLKELLRCL